MADGSAKLSGRDYEFQEPTLRKETTVRRENPSGESHGDGEEFQPEETKDDEGINKDFGVHAEARKDFYAISEISFIVIKLNREVQLYVPRKESYPIPLNYIDFISATYADLEIAKENEFMTVGMSMRTKICQIRGRVSQDSRY